MTPNSDAPFTDPGSILRDLFETNPQPMWVYDSGTFSFLDVNGAIKS